MHVLAETLDTHFRQIAKARHPSRQLEAIRAVETALAQCRRAIVVEMMLDPLGTTTWSDIGRLLGVSRQAARQTYTRHVEDELHRRIRARIEQTNGGEQ